MNSNQIERKAECESKLFLETKLQITGSTISNEAVLHLIDDSMVPALVEQFLRSGMDLRAAAASAVTSSISVPAIGIVACAITLSPFGMIGYANLLSYLRAGPGAVKLVAPAHRNRSGFESLVRSGLAGDHIAEVPTGALLEALTSDELRKVSTTPIPSKARKKNLAVEFLLTQDGVRGRTLEMIGSTDLFYTLPEHPELRGLDLDDLRDGLEFAWNATALVVETYLVAALAPTNRIYEGRHLSAQRFKASNVNDILTCRSCRKLSGACRPLRDWDRFPFHFGCRCFLLLEV
jgi:hypothetical protein